jgi:hypothetical protein
MMLGEFLQSTSRRSSPHKYRQVWQSPAHHEHNVLGEVLEVSRSGFYDYQSRQAHPTIDADEVALLARVKATAGATRSSYGSRCMTKVLPEEGFAVGRGKARETSVMAGRIRSFLLECVHFSLDAERIRITLACV